MISSGPHGVLEVDMGVGSSHGTFSLHFGIPQHSFFNSKVYTRLHPRITSRGHSKTEGILTGLGPDFKVEDCIVTVKIE